MTPYGIIGQQSGIEVNLCYSLIVLITMNLEGIFVKIGGSGLVHMTTSQS